MPITIVELVSQVRTHRLFDLDLEGNHINVIVTADAIIVDHWIRTTYNLHQPYISRLIVGLGVQWTPGDEDAPAETLQLCVGRRCLVYQLSYSPFVPYRLREFLLNPGNTFIGFWNHLDRWKLEISRHRLEMLVNPLDIRHCVRTADGNSLERAPIEQIVQECLGIQGVRMRRDISMSNWGDRHLQIAQVRQATLDAHCAFQIGWNIIMSARRHQ